MDPLESNSIHTCGWSALTENVFMFLVVFVFCELEMHVMIWNGIECLFCRYCHLLIMWFTVALLSRISALDCRYTLLLCLYSCVLLTVFCWRGYAISLMLLHCIEKSLIDLCSWTSVLDGSDRSHEVLTANWKMLFSVSVNAWQLEWMHLPQHQIQTAGQCHEAGPCWAQWWGLWLTAGHWCSRILWYVMVLCLYYWV